MADVTLFSHRAVAVELSPLRIDDRGNPWLVVRLCCEATSYHIDGAYPRAVERAEDFARAILSGCAAVRGARKVVPIEGTAPYEHAAVDAETESVIDLAPRWNGTRPPTKPAA